jgi:uncharacterized protein (TIGR03435 family)
MGIELPPPSDKPGTPPDLGNAMLSQLGLKLATTRARVDVIVIDRVGKPTAS